MKLNQNVEVPQQTVDPALEELITRRWAQTTFLDFTNESRNSIMSAGGEISWNIIADKLKWDNQFFILPVKGANSPDRYIGLPMPTSGVTDAAGAERASVDGITLNVWDTLWLVHTRGSANNVGNTWKVFNYADALTDTYYNDDNAYLIAIRNTNNSVYLRNGIVVPSGKTVPAGKSIPLLTDADIEAANKDGAVLTPSLRTLGPGAQQAAPGTHVGSSDGHPAATPTLDGFITAADKAKLDGLSAQAIGAFHAYNNVDQLDIASRTFVKVLLQAKEIDVSGWFDTATSIYTPQKAGVYEFGGGVFLAPGVDNSLIYAILYKNGVRVRDINISPVAGTAAAVAYGSAPRVTANGTTDYFELYIYHTLGVDTSDIIAFGVFTTYFAGGFVGTL